MTLPSHLSVSDLKLYQTCPQKFHNKIIHKRGHDRMSASLEAGTLTHAYLEAKLRGLDPLLATRTAQDDMYARAEAEGFYAGAQADKALTAFDNLLPALEAWQIPPDWQIIAVEKTYTLEIPGGPDIQIIGRVDTVVGYNGSLWHLQHKTLAGASDYSVFSELQRTDWHECVYSRMIEEDLGEPVAGTILNIFRKLSKAALDRGEQAHIIRPLTRSKTIVNQALADISQCLYDIRNELSGIRRVEKRRIACAGPFRNDLCTYKDVCDGHEDLSSERFVDLKGRYDSDDAV